MTGVAVLPAKRRWRGSRPPKPPSPRRNARCQPGTQDARGRPAAGPRTRARSSRQECCVSDREAPASAACVARGHGEDGENADLKEEIRARPPVKSAMQLEINRSVGPSDPGQREDAGEFEKPVRREVRSQMISRLRDNGGVGKVVEKLERTDTAVDDRFAVRTRRAPEP